MIQVVERYAPLVPQVPDGPRTTMDMVQEAVSRGASVEVVEKLLGLHERWEAAQARRAFDAAISGAKAEIPVIIKSRSGHRGMYEDMGAIAEAIAPALSKNGLSYRYRTQQTDKISVTCIIAHKDGHSEETTLSAMPDNEEKTKDGKNIKNAIQAIGSTVTYLQRYTLKAALGLAAAKDDDGDASQASPEKISDAQLNELIKLADEVEANKGAFCNWAGVDSLADILAKDFEKAKKALEAKRGATMLRARS